MDYLRYLREAQDLGIGRERFHSIWETESRTKHLQAESRLLEIQIERERLLGRVHDESGVPESVEKLTTELLVLKNDLKHQMGEGFKSMKEIMNSTYTMKCNDELCSNNELKNMLVQIRIHSKIISDEIVKVRNQMTVLQETELNRNRKRKLDTGDGKLAAKDQESSSEQVTPCGRTTPHKETTTHKESTPREESTPHKESPREESAPHEESTTMETQEFIIASATPVKLPAVPQETETLTTLYSRETNAKTIPSTGESDELERSENPKLKINDSQEQEFTIVQQEYHLTSLKTREVENTQESEVFMAQKESPLPYVCTFSTETEAAKPDIPRASIVTDKNLNDNTNSALMSIAGKQDATVSSPSSDLCPTEDTPRLAEISEQDSFKADETVKCEAIASENPTSKDNTMTRRNDEKKMQLRRKGPTSFSFNLHDRTPIRNRETYVDIVGYHPARSRSRSENFDGHGEEMTFTVDCAQEFVLDRKFHRTGYYTTKPVPCKVRLNLEFNEVNRLIVQLCVLPQPHIRKWPVYFQGEGEIYNPETEKYSHLWTFDLSRCPEPEDGREVRINADVCLVTSWAKYQNVTYDKIKERNYDKGNYLRIKWRLCAYNEDSALT
nr:hypothetical protein BgiMline_008582 [Biomphalaria glabrata]